MSTFLDTRDWDATRSPQQVVGDFNSDGKLDIAAMYTYGLSNTRIWVFENNGQGKFNTSMFLSSPNWDALRSPKLLSGNFYGNSGTDIAAMYTYGGGNTKIWMFY